MKKIIGASLAILSLTSCGGPKIESPEDALSLNQVSVIENIEKLYELQPEQARSAGTGSILIDTEAGTVEGNITYDFQANQETYESAGNFDIDFDITDKTGMMLPTENLGANLSMDLVTMKEKFFFKLNTLNIIGAEDDFQISSMLSMITPFQERWFYVENTLDEQEMQAMFNNDLFKHQKQMISLAKQYTVLEYVSTNENEDYYDYEVKLHEENLVGLYTDFINLAATEENGLEATEDDKLELKEAVKDFNEEFKGNIKIDKKDLEYFNLTFTNEDMVLNLENTKTNLNLDFKEKEEAGDVMTITGIKTKNSYDANINVSEGEEALFDGTLYLESDGKNTKVKLGGTITDDYSGEQTTINMEINDTTTKQDVTVEGPSDAENFEDVINEAMGQIYGAPMQVDYDYDYDEYDYSM